jgi:FKBP-type peptidyl-prolyl cis-trans isomerase SlyD
VELAVGKDRWVTVHYRLFDSQGEAVEEGERELTYLHGGYGELFDALEQVLEGQLPGFETSVYLEPEHTFGDYDAGLLRLASRDQFPGELEEGMSFDGVPGEDPDGRIWMVTDISEEAVVLDGNHPLAGMALRFELKVIEVREAEEDEIEAEQARARDD